jgi:hypothetical protein
VRSTTGAHEVRVDCEGRLRVPRLVVALAAWHGHAPARVPAKRLALHLAGAYEHAVPDVLGPEREEHEREERALGRAQRRRAREHHRERGGRSGLGRGKSAALCEARGGGEEEVVEGGSPEDEAPEGAVDVGAGFLRDDLR